MVYDIISSAMSDKKCTPSSGAASAGTSAFTFVDGPARKVSFLERTTGDDGRHPGKLDSEEEELVQLWLRGVSKGFGPENLVLKRGGRIREGPDHGRIDIQPSIPLVRALSSQLVFEIDGV